MRPIGGQRTEFGRHRCERANCSVATGRTAGTERQAEEMRNALPAGAYVGTYLVTCCMYICGWVAAAANGGDGDGDGDEQDEG